MNALFTGGTATAALAIGVVGVVVARGVVVVVVFESGVRPSRGTRLREHRLGNTLGEGLVHLVHRFRRIRAQVRLDLLGGFLGTLSVDGGCVALANVLLGTVVLLRERLPHALVVLDGQFPLFPDFLDQTLGVFLQPLEVELVNAGAFTTDLGDAEVERTCAFEVQAPVLIRRGVGEGFVSIPEDDVDEPLAASGNVAIFDTLRGPVLAEVVVGLSDR